MKKHPIYFKDGFWHCPNPLYLVAPALLLAGCSHAEFGKRDMKVTTPLFSYESHTEGFKGEKQISAPAEPSK